MRYAPSPWPPPRAGPGPGAWAGEAEAKKWIDSEFQPSTLSKDQQMAEMKWFIEAAKKLQAKGVKEISVVSETITTHEYESKTLAKAFRRSPASRSSTT
jgi:glycerol transport system substrate-binding protein